MVPLSRSDFALCSSSWNTIMHDVMITPDSRDAYDTPRCSDAGGCSWGWGGLGQSLGLVAVAFMSSARLGPEK